MADVELPWLGFVAGGEDDVTGRAPPWHSVNTGEVVSAPRVEVHTYPTCLSVPPCSPVRVALLTGPCPLGLAWISSSWEWGSSSPAVAGSG
jgi:hypothetical protein